MTFAAFSLGNRARISATAPETIAVASLVPLDLPRPVFCRGLVVTMSSAGAARATSLPWTDPGQKSPSRPVPDTATTPGMLAG